MLQLLVSTRFHVLFHSPHGVLVTFPSRYLFTIGRQTVFSLTRWSWQIHTGFHVPRITWDTLRGSKVFIYRTVTVYGATFQTLQLTLSHPMSESLNPLLTFVDKVWAVPFSLAATKGITDLFYFPPDTKMFQFSGLPRAILWIQIAVVRHYSNGVTPFGYPRIVAYNGFSWLFAVYCVLHRLLTPRYSPCALCSLTNV